MIFRNKFAGLEFPSKKQILSSEYEIAVEFIKKRSSSVNVKGKTLSFRLSSYLSRGQVITHFNELLEKISRKIAKQQILGNGEEKTFRQIFEEGKFKFAGEDYNFEFTKNRGVKLKENTFYVNYHTKSDLLEKYVPKLLCQKYGPRIKNFIQAINYQTYNFDIGDIVLKLVGSKWGHCTPHNDIMINLKLLNADLDILQYVVIHELAHIRHKNHSPNFWKEVEKFCPNYKLVRKKLKENPPHLYN
ncbi:MAG: M48 family metallopeptidase [Nanoarchaeota archaeon]